MEYLKRFWPLYLITAAIFMCIALGADQAVTTIAENVPVHRDHIIVIDAGHGGEDGGANACNGKLESGINLQIALRLEDLCHLLGYKTVMIRRTDVSVYTEGKTLAAKKASDLRQRARIVNETENAILISIHQNTYSDSIYRGAQVFYAASSGSKELAMKIQSMICDSINRGSSRKVKPAEHVYLMRNIQKTGVLVECGFISNPQETKLLCSEGYQKKMCCVLICALSQHINA